MDTTHESKETIASSQVLDKAGEGTSTSTPAEPFDASKSSNQSKGDPVFSTEEPSSLPPPPRKKSGATLITLPADDARQYPDSRSSTSTSKSKTHTRTNTFGTISYDKFQSSERQPRAIKEEAETNSSRRL